MSENAIKRYTDLRVPNVFTTEQLDWLPWLEPVSEAELTPRHFAGLVDPARAKSAYFRLLAHDPEILESRTRTDKDIFYNTANGLPRSERELAATATSRSNGCIYCASVHARFAMHFAQNDAEREAISRLLDQGSEAELPGRWRAIVDAAVALTQTPPRFQESHVQALRASGLDDADIIDVIGSVAFFNWANRLMLSLGEPERPVK